jgi:hypothetical protein
MITQIMIPTTKATKKNAQYIPALKIEPIASQPLRKNQQLITSRK